MKSSMSGSPWVTGRRLLVDTGVLFGTVVSCSQNVPGRSCCRYSRRAVAGRMSRSPILPVELTPVTEAAAEFVVAGVFSGTVGIGGADRRLRPRGRIPAARKGKFD